MGQFKKIVLVNIFTLVLALILILFERKFGGNLLFWLSFAAITSFIGAMVWAVVTFLIRAFK